MMAPPAPADPEHFIRFMEPVILLEVGNEAVDSTLSVMADGLHRAIQVRVHAPCASFRQQVHPFHPGVCMCVCMQGGSADMRAAGQVHCELVDSMQPHLLQASKQQIRMVRAGW